MINKKNFLSLTLIFLWFDLIAGALVLFFNSKEVFFDWLLVSGLSFPVYFFFCFLLFVLFKADMKWAFSANAVCLLIGSFIGIIGCAIKLFDGTEYLLGLEVLIPVFTNAVIWEYFPNFYIKRDENDGDDK